MLAERRWCRGEIDTEFEGNEMQKTNVSDLHSQLNAATANRASSEVRSGISELVESQLDDVSGGNFWLWNEDGSGTFVRG